MQRLFYTFFFFLLISLASCSNEGNINDKKEELIESNTSKMSQDKILAKSLILTYDSISNKMFDIITYLDSIDFDKNNDKKNFGEDNLSIDPSLASDMSFRLRDKLVEMHPQLDSLCIPYFNYEIFDSWDEIDNFLDSLLEVRQQEFVSLKEIKQEIEVKQREQTLTYWINRINNDIELIRNHECRD